MKAQEPTYVILSLFITGLICRCHCRVLACLFLCIPTVNVSGQSITEIITDYQGYWKSSSTSLNVIKPNNNHNLVSFRFNGVRYSTGVNDALLTSQGQTFVAGDYRALPVQSVTGTVNSNTKIGVGAMFDGILSGASFPPPSGNIPYYLTDGLKGLNIGTCVANLPAGTLFFSVGNINGSSIGDGIPDVVITQTADPSSTNFDRYEFTDIHGTRIGNFKDIILTSINPVGNWMADFYEASLNPISLLSGFTNTERAIRLWAADFSAFGITAADIGRIAYFKISLNGNSDVAFVAYNHNAINFSSMLPVELSSLSASPNGNGIMLSWETRSESNSDRFIIESSRDGSNFRRIAEKVAAGESSSRRKYSYFDEVASTGTHYYRLKQVDLDGRFKYSMIVQAEMKEKTLPGVYPNPATNQLVIPHQTATGYEQLKIVDTRGTTVFQRTLTRGATYTVLSQLNWAKGLYLVNIADARKQTTQSVIVQ